MPQLATFGAKTPVTVITGFLGSGKSTLVNHILSSKGSKHIAVVENEFGEVNIDKSLVGDKLDEKEDLYNIENGCVCCGLRRDIHKAFQTLLHNAVSKNRQLDHILLETTGLADPSPVAFTFFANPWIAARFRLDSITCLVDAKHLMQHLEDGQHGSENTINEAVQQIAFADLILLNKVDLVDDLQKADVMESIRRINNTARIVECQLTSEQGRPALHQILDTNTFSVQRALAIDPTFLDTDSESEWDEDSPSATPGPQDTIVPMSGEYTPAATTGAAAELDGSPEPHGDSLQGDAAVSVTTAQAAAGGAAGDGSDEQSQGTKRAHSTGQEMFQAPNQFISDKRPKRRRKKLHDLSDVSSVGITATGQLDEYRFNMYMKDLLSEKGKDIFRCKGVLSVHGYGNKKFVFQGVHETICYGPADHGWKDGETRVNQIVFIGRGLDRKTLVEGFKTCIWHPLPRGWHEALDPKTKRPYYWNTESGQRTWSRPTTTSTETGLPHCTSSQATTQQPSSVLPASHRTSGSQLAAHSSANNMVVGVETLSSARGSSGGNSDQQQTVVVA